MRTSSSTTSGPLYHPLKTQPASLSLRTRPILDEIIDAEIDAILSTDQYLNSHRASLVTLLPEEGGDTPPFTPAKQETTSRTKVTTYIDAKTFRQALCCLFNACALALAGIDCVSSSASSTAHGAQAHSVIGAELFLQARAVCEFDKSISR